MHCENVESEDEKGWGVEMVGPVSLHCGCFGEMFMENN